MAPSHATKIELTTAPPEVKRIGPDDLKAALRAGLADFMAKPSHLLFLGLLYPVLGLILGSTIFQRSAFPVLFPVVSGFALLGPLAAVGLYEISRRREVGQSALWRHAFSVLRSPSILSIAVLGLVLAVIFITWLFAAQAVYRGVYGAQVTFPTYAAFLADVLSTSRGWTLILVGHLVGAVFAALALSISVVSFPLLLDRDVGLPVAVSTSLRAVSENPVTMALWGLIVGALLAAASLPLFVGLAVVMPILGHATWHLYRRVVVPAEGGDHPASGRPRSQGAVGP